MIHDLTVVFFFFSLRRHFFLPSLTWVLPLDQGDFCGSHFTSSLRYYYKINFHCYHIFGIWPKLIFLVNFY